MSLVDIMIKYNIRNDTHYEFGTDKEFNHKYCSGFYDEALLPYQDKNIRLLELGIHRGGSMALWHHYFPNADLYGVDPYDFGAKTNCEPYPRVKIIYADGYRKEFAESLPNFDIIIDDGPHTKESHLQSLTLYLPKLNQGGMFIIEDIGQMEWTEDYRTLVPPNMVCGVVDLREPSNMSDSIIFWVKYA
jgi:hypothetical protein